MSFDELQEHYDNLFERYEIVEEYMLDHAEDLRAMADIMKEQGLSGTAKELIKVAKEIEELFE